MNAVTTRSAGALAMTDDQLLSVMRDTLYPGARMESVQMVLSYCRARGLDPMKKPVHIVPMWMDGGMRDVVLPGITSYRIDAARTGEYDGKSEPEFGPDMTRTFKGKVKRSGSWEDVAETVTFPAWCKITVMRRGKAFHAKEYWLENYATQGKSEVPNAMWAKRPYGQLAKCAEAQALRMAFPEEVGGQNTAEEMEGKSYGVEPEPRNVVGVVVPDQPAIAAPEQQPDAEAGRTARSFSFDLLDDQLSQFVEIEEIRAYLAQPKVQAAERKVRERNQGARWDEIVERHRERVAPAEPETQEIEQ
jgi:phage recombination protein Bet